MKLRTKIDRGIYVCYDFADDLFECSDAYVRVAGSRRTSAALYDCRIHHNDAADFIGSTVRFLFRWRNCRRRQEISRKGILILRSGRSRMMRSDNSVRILRR
mgnify:CR=1 FL=1